MNRCRFCLRSAVCLVLSVILLAAALPVAAGDAIRYEFPQKGEETIVSPSALMLYMGLHPTDDVILYEKEADRRYEPGALIRTAIGGYAMKLITEKKIDPDTVTASYSIDLFNRYVAGSGLHVALMNFGETWKLRDLLTVSMIQTAADCAVTLAAALAETPEDFVAGLNEYALELGCTNSHFTNVVGLNEEGQYMSARDIATFSRYAMQYPEIASMWELSQYTVTPVSGGRRRSWPSSNDMIRPSAAAFYTYAVGGRTGGSLTEMGVMEYGALDGYEYMAVVLGSPRKTEKGELTNTAYADAKRLIRWGLVDFSYTVLVQKNEPVARLPLSGAAGKRELSLVPSNDVTAVLGKDIDPASITRTVTTTVSSCAAPITAGTVYGTLELYYDGKQLVSSDLIAPQDIPRDSLTALRQGLHRVITSGWFVAIIVLLLLLLGGYILFAIRVNRKRRRRWK